MEHNTEESEILNQDTSDPHNNHGQQFGLPDDDRYVPWSIQDITGVGLVGFVSLVIGFALANALAALLPNLHFLFIYLPLVTLLYLFVFLTVQYLGPRRRGLDRDQSLYALGFRNFHYYHVPLAFATLFVAYFAEGAYAYAVKIFFGIQEINPAIRELKDLFGDSTAGLVAALIVVSIIAPIVEETVFRGFLYAGLRNYFPISFSAAASALVFAAFHMSLISLVPIFILGLFLAWLYERENSLYPAIFFHSMNNSVAILVVYFV